MKLQDWTAVVIEGPESVAGYAPELELQQDGPHVVSWIEGQHRRAFEIAEVLRSNDEAFWFRDMQGREFKLRPMTLELYRQHVRQHTLGRPDFATLGELLAAMRAEW